MRVTNLRGKAFTSLSLNTQNAISQPFKRSKAFIWLGLSVQCGGGILLLWWIVMWSGVDSKQLTQQLAQASLLPLTLSILCFATAMGLGALRYRLFLPSSTSITYLIGVALFQNALLTFMPWRIGEISYPLMLRRDHDIPLASSGAAILAIRLADLLVVLAVTLMGGRKLSLDIRWVGIIFGAATLLTLFAVFAFTTGGRNIPPLLQTVVCAFRLVCQPLYFMSLVLLSVSAFALTTLQSTFTLRAMAFAVTLPDIALLNAVSLLAALLPIHPPGGWGTIDSIQILVLERLGYDPRIAIPAILAAHSFYTLLILIGGITGWLLRGKSCSRRKTGF